MYNAEISQTISYLVSKDYELKDIERSYERYFKSYT